MSTLTDSEALDKATEEIIFLRHIGGLVPPPDSEREVITLRRMVSAAYGALYHQIVDWDRER